MAARIRIELSSSSGSEAEDDAPSSKTARAAQPQVKSQASSDLPPAPDHEVCSICLEKPVHPVQLECKHEFCYLCAKGLTESASPICSLCRAPISRGYIKKPELVRRTASDLALDAEGSSPWQWFYEGKNGWWKFETRNNEEIEEGFGQNQEGSIELLICGHLYVIDFKNMVQYRKNQGFGGGGRKRKIKRDILTASCKGVAGLVAKD